MHRKIWDFFQLSSLPIGWIDVTSLSFSLSWAMPSLIFLAVPEAAYQDTGWPILAYFLVPGLGLGLAQALYLERLQIIKSRWFWPLATNLAMIVILIGLAYLLVLYSMIATIVIMESGAPEKEVVLAFMQSRLFIPAYASGFLAGGLIGFSQLLFLPGMLIWRLRWIALSAAGWGVGFSVFLLLQQRRILLLSDMTYLYDLSSPFDLALLTMQLAAIGMFGGLATGIGLPRSKPSDDSNEPGTLDG